MGYEVKNKDTMKNKVLIFSQAMELGGVERSLLGLLDSIDYDRYDVDLFLMRHSGELMPYLNRRVNLSLAEKILSPTEKAQFDAAAGKNRAFLTFWVLKEASAKLSGRGLHGYPNDTAFSLNDPRVRELEGCLVAILTEGETYAV